MLKKIHYSWFICVGCTLLFFCTGGLGLTGFSAYFPFMTTLNELRQTQISVIIFIRSLFGVFGMLFVNAFLRKFEIRRVVTAAMAVSVLSFLTYGFTGNFIGYCTAAALAGIAYGFGSMIPVSILISRWFNEHQGLAIGICMAATGVSAFIASPIITWMVENLSLKMSFIIEAVFVAVVMVIVWTLLRSMPSCLDLEPLGADEGGKTTKYAARTAPKGLYWAMVIGFLILGAAANNLHSNLSVLYQSVGFDSSRISGVISMFGISLAIGKCACGQLSDKIGVFKACMLLFIMSIAGCGMFCLARNGSMTMATIAVLLVGAGMSVASVATSTYAVDIATEEDYPGVVSRFQTMQTIGGLAFAIMPGVLADMTGDYILAYEIMFAFVLISAVVIQGAYLKIKSGEKAA